MADAPSFPAKQGTPNKKKALIIGGVAIVGGGLGLLYFRRKSASNAATTSAATTDPGIDPNTGVPYSQEGYGGAVGAAAGALGTYNPLTGQYTPGLGSLPASSVPASNAQWAQAAAQILIQDGYDPVAATTALGLYLTGAPLTQDQYDIVQAAIALEGQPPNGAPTPVLVGGGGSGVGGSGSGGGSHPPPPPSGDPSGPPGPGTGTGGVTPRPLGKVPSVVGEQANFAIGNIVSSGFTWQEDTPFRNPANTYITTAQNPAGGSDAPLGSAIHVSFQQHTF